MGINMGTTAFYTLVALVAMPLSQAINDFEEFSIEDSGLNELGRERRDLKKDRAVPLNINYDPPKNQLIPPPTTSQRRHDINILIFRPRLPVRGHAIIKEDNSKEFDYNKIIFKLEISTIIRNNIVNVFGYILYQRNFAIDFDKYSALMEIYTALRQKRIYSHEFLIALPRISYKNPHDRLLTIFKVLTQTRPVSLMGAVEIWTNALTRYEVNITSILRPHGGALAVDLFQDIDFSILHILARPTQFPSSAMKLAPRDIVESMGRFMGNIFGAIIEGSLQITRQLVAHIMFHTPLYALIPEVDEAIHYLVDIMIEPTNFHLDFAFQGIDKMSRKSPYALVTHVLTKIVQSPSIDPTVKECSEIILPHFLPTSTMSVNIHFDAMSPILTRKEIDYVVLFSSISTGEYPEDIVKAKEMVLYSIQNNELDMFAILQGFVKHDYATPDQLIVVLLERIKRRGTVPGYLLEPLNALIIHVKLKYAALNLRFKPLVTYNEFKNLGIAFFTPHMSPEIKTKLTDIINLLGGVNIPWKTVFEKINPSECARPRQYVRKVLTLLISLKLIVKADIVDQISQFIAITDQSGDPKNCPKVTCVGNNVQEPSTTLPPLPEIVTTTTPAPAAEKKTVADIDISTLFSSLDVPAEYVSEVLELEEYVNATLATQFSHMDLSKYLTMGQLLKFIFTQYLSSHTLKSDQKMFTLFQKYIGKIQFEGLGARPLQYITKKITRIVDMNRALLALNVDDIQRNGQVGHLETIYQFLAGDFRLHNYLDSFQRAMTYNTRAEFLTAFFDLIITFPNTPSYEVKESFKSLSSYIRTDGPGAEPLDYVETVVTKIETSI